MTEKIAIIGYSSTLPGSNNEFEYWDMISESINNIKDLPEDRLDITAYYNTDPSINDKIYCKRGGFIDDFDFDPREYGLNLLQMEDCDTNQVLSLLKVKQAMQSANIDPFKGRKNIGCVLGIGGGQKLSHEMYSRLNYNVVEKVAIKMGMKEKDIENFVEKYKSNFPLWRLDSFPGFLGNVTSGRCCNVFNLDGMNCVVDAACASSLTAIKVAIDELLYGDCRTMIAGATCTDNSIGMYMAFSKTPVFTKNQDLTAYNHNSSGMLIGEGSAIVILKKLDDAIQDGDKIHGVILGCAASSDGKSSGIYTPTFKGQEEVVKRALRKANVDPRSITMIEGHGTGTSKGDENELSVLKSVFNDCDKQQIAVGSIKSNIGHLKAVAGMASLIKILMCLKHKTIAPSINVEYPPPQLELSKSALYINTKLRPWFTENNITRRAGISSFGFGGTNFHLILEEFEKEHTEPYRMNTTYSSIILDGENIDDLIEKCKSEINLLMENELNFHKLTKIYKIRKLNSQHPRVGFVALNAEECLISLKKIITKLQNESDSVSWEFNNIIFRKNEISTDKSIVSLFTGQGSQYTYMFNEIALNWPQFRNSINKMNKYSSDICNILTSDILYPREPYQNESPIDENIIKQTRNSSLATSACSIGCYNIFKDSGFKSHFFAGHSLGEFTALHASGIIDENDYFYLMAKRANIMDKKFDITGTMAAIIRDDVNSVKFSENIQIANINSSTQIVISGKGSDIDNEIKNLQLLDKNIKCVKLNVGNAYHSEIMHNNQKEFNQVINEIQFKQPHTSIYSNFTGDKYEGIDLKNYVSQHMTKSVKFVDQIKNIYKNGGRIFVEFGPTNVLNKFVKDILKDKNDIFTISINPNKKLDSDKQLREAAVQLSVLGVKLENFDPWQIDNKYNEIVKKTKTTINLSGASYVSKKTKNNTDNIMNDGYKICYDSNSNNNNANNKNNKNSDNSLIILNKELTEVKKQLDLALNNNKTLNDELNIYKNNNKYLNEFMDNFKKYEQSKNNLYQQFLSKYSNELNINTSNNISEKSNQVVINCNHNSYSKISKPKKYDTMKTIMHIIAEKTGYDTDMIETDMELETDLGIDSIKRVEILGAVQTALNITVNNVEQLSQTQTVQDVIDFMNNELGIVSDHEPNIPVVQNNCTDPDPIIQNNSNSNTMKIIMDIIAEKTGYETDMIETDMELETDLGIDSIKRVEILGAVQTALKITVNNVEQLSQTQTVQDVIDFMNSELTNGKDIKNVSIKKNLNEDIITLSQTELVNINLPGKVKLKGSKEKCILMIDNNIEVSVKLRLKLLENKWNVIVIKLPNINKNSYQKEINVRDFSENTLVSTLNQIENDYGKPEGIIYLDSNENKTEILLEWLFLLAKHTKKYLTIDDDSERKFFIGITFIDGYLGISNRRISRNIDEIFSISQKGGINGLIKSLKLEWDNTFCRTIDLDPTSSDNYVEYIINELHCPDMTIRETSYNNNKRFTINETNGLVLNTSLVNNNDIFIVTGGAKGITPHCLKEIAKEINGGTFYLLGRSELVNEESWSIGLEGKELSSAGLTFLKNSNTKITPKLHKKLITKIESNREILNSIYTIKQYNATVKYIVCDVNNEQNINSVIKNINIELDGKSITGIIHASGVLRDKKIENKKIEDYRFVYGTKINGLYNLLKNVVLSDLKHLILYSSLAGVYGNIGQTDYAMANEVFNKFAYHFKNIYKKCNVKSLCFGPWDSGMVTPELKSHFIDNGVEIIPLEEGSEIVSDIIVYSQNNQILFGNWIESKNKCMYQKNTIDFSISSGNKFLDNHVIKNNKILPFTLIISFLTDLVAKSYPGFNLISICNVCLHKGIELNEDAIFTINQQKIRSKFDLTVDSKLTVSGNSKTFPSARLTINLDNKGMNTSNISFNNQCDNKVYPEIYGKILFHTGIFKYIKKIVNYSEKSITLLCNNYQITDDISGEFKTKYFNGFVYDVAFQIMLVWNYLYNNSNSLPQSVTYINFYQNIPSLSDFFVTFIPKIIEGNKLEGVTHFHDEYGKLYISDYKSVTINDKLLWNE
jgi:acyl carrier protein